MASRFVSGGTIIGSGDDEGAASIEKTVRDSTSAGKSPGVSGSVGGMSKTKSIEWEAVQKDLEEQRRKRDEARRAAVEGSGGEKSLYEILQANKGDYCLTHSTGPFSLFRFRLFFSVCFPFS
jgi:hypothetical protein